MEEKNPNQEFFDNTARMPGEHLEKLESNIVGQKLKTTELHRNADAVYKLSKEELNELERTVIETAQEENHAEEESKLPKDSQERYKLFLTMLAVRRGIIYMLEEPNLKHELNRILNEEQTDEQNNIKR